MAEGLKPLYSPEEIRSTIGRLAGEIRADYASRTPVLVGVLKGAFVFLADLVRALEMPVEVDFIRLSSYGTRDVPTPKAAITKDIELSVEGRDVLVVEDIIDRGTTIEAVMDHLEGKNPATLRLCTLLLKEGGGTGRKIDYIGKEIGDGFVVGYGMDYKERYRELRALYTIDTKDGGD